MDFFLSLIFFFFLAITLEIALSPHPGTPISVLPNFTINLRMNSDCEIQPLKPAATCNLVGH